MPASELILGIDFGTSNTVAVVQHGSGRAEPLLFDGSPVLPSAVWLDDGGALVTGRDALHTARLDPARFEPNPKRRIDDHALLLGRTEVPVTDAIGAVLTRVAAEALRTAGAAPGRLRMTHPAQWGTARKQTLLDAAGKAGLPRPELVAEPVAAATYFTQVLRSPVEPGGHVVVFDLGGGTLDIAIVARTGTGFDVVAVDGRDDLGGLDIDAMVVDCIAAGLPADARSPWQQLIAPTTPQQQRAARMLWDDARTAKEMLSRQTTAPVQVPLVDRDVHVTRDELEARARPRLTEAAELTADLMRRTGVGPFGTGLFLVGGASRIPLVATALLRATRVAPTALDRPELVVAHGALTTTAAAVPPPSTEPVPPPGTEPFVPPTLGSPPPAAEPARNLGAMPPSAIGEWTGPIPPARGEEPSQRRPAVPEAARRSPRWDDVAPLLDSVEDAQRAAARQRRRRIGLTGLIAAVLLATGLIVADRSGWFASDGPYSLPDACSLTNGDSWNSLNGKATRQSQGVPICIVTFAPHDGEIPDVRAVRLKIERYTHRGRTDAADVTAQEFTRREDKLTGSKVRKDASIGSRYGYVLTTSDGLTETAACPDGNLILTVVVTEAKKSSLPGNDAEPLLADSLSSVG